MTGANGYIGNAVAKAFARAGWRTYGLVRREDATGDLARSEIQPAVGTAGVAALDGIGDVTFDVVVSNTEDRTDPSGHLAAVRVMLDEAVVRSEAAGRRPLIMFSSGCKDYGAMARKHGDPALAPHTEESPLAPRNFLIPRCTFGARLLDKAESSFDAIVLRPTIVYGLSSSYYGALFHLAAKSRDVLTIVGDPDAVMHSCHVDDCADAYVLLAEHPDRNAIANQAYNISNRHYETAREIGEALARSYGLNLTFEAPDHDGAAGDAARLFNFWQWVGSDKIRSATEWHEKRASFADGIDQYRAAFEANLPTARLKTNARDARSRP
ncbi:NAD-dependent epimerase/dehydratase family protein [Bradyrhizobium genosp. P]|uniref:NAD-dependent epimerase/dehydratase family protein n=1 Tax=Bradyrhizobium genosp. P TaxID=83641 RepID=UPI003CFB3428